MARYAACDIVAVGGGPAALNGTHHRVFLMLYGPAPLSAVRTAVRLARSRDARLRIVVQHTPSSRNAAPNRPSDSSALRAAATMAARLEPAMRIETDTVAGYPNELAARLTGADLLVLAGHERPPIHWRGRPNPTT